jgi:hypothetical protein
VEATGETVDVVAVEVQGGLASWWSGATQRALPPPFVSRICSMTTCSLRVSNTLLAYNGCIGGISLNLGSVAVVGLRGGLSDLFDYRLLQQQL